MRQTSKASNETTFPTCEIAERMIAPVAGGLSLVVQVRKRKAVIELRSSRLKSLLLVQHQCDPGPHKPPEDRHCEGETNHLQAFGLTLDHPDETDDATD